MRLPGIRLCIAASALAMPLLTMGCGAPAAPQPPTLNLPQPVADLSAVRSGNVVRLTWTVPAKTTDKLPLRGTVTAVVCRSVDSGACVRTHTQAVQPQQSMQVSDALPPDLASGAPHLLTYQVTLQNSAGRSADVPSNTADAAGGGGPADVAGLAVAPDRKGVVLTWQAAPGATPTMLRFERTLTGGAAQPASAAPQPLGAPHVESEPAQQTLQVPENGSNASGHPPRALDATAVKGRTYRYTAQRIARITLAGETLEIASAPSAPVTIEYRDIFPPQVPTGLVSAADTSGHTIDLSWSPVADPHLGGYLVYRRNLAGAGAPERITPAEKPLNVTDFSDTTAVPGQHYAYSVSAVDLAGNESARSPEVEDGLPQIAPDARAHQP